MIIAKYRRCNHAPGCLIHHAESPQGNHVAVAVFDIVLHDESIFNAGNLAVPLILSAHLEREVSDAEIGDGRSDDIVPHTCLIQEKRFASGF